MEKKEYELSQIIDEMRDEIASMATKKRQNYTVRFLSQVIKRFLNSLVKQRKKF